MESNANHLNPPLDPNTKHSGPGIASFVVSLLALIAYIAAVAIVLDTSRGLIISGVPVTNEIIMNHAGFMVAGLIVLAAIILTLTGSVLGIIGLALKNRKKLFAILGVIICAIPPIFMLILFFVRTSQL
ncbi:hypothetical protein [Paenibacillus sp. YPG26]|uniref:hypothetical protein n=1 Tax=Paenibacillus sp. YPG26 TaxID=2878915 RepID=UPI002041A7CC|nr:hypothetical protein [Paenibacillus sp. YPG26]USB32422.1 hypothetical protein LDO05_13985 [Paenibacillus sp. YPG26]